MNLKDGIFYDDEGRTLTLRGVNLGGDSKIPFCRPEDQILPEFLDKQKKVSFTGRPFPLEEAEEHFKRLKKAGMNFLRFVTTWEAVEHEGPGIYDEDYLAYLRKILLIAEKEGISVFMDPHQDVWSRWTGGDGAPAWTMEKIGIDLDLLDCCGAAITRQRYGIYNKSKKYPNGKPFPKMMWASNYNRYAALTMFTLFFAGIVYAPHFLIDGENVQDWLQNHYIAAFLHVQRRLKNCAAIAGWGAMNEPYFGLISHQNLMQSEDVMIPFGPKPNPWQSIQAASGYAVKIPVYSLLSVGKKISHYETLGVKGISIFKEGFSCPWKQHGVWKDDGGKPKLLKQDYFSTLNGRRVDFNNDFLKPFIIKFINSMKDSIKDSVKETKENKFFFIEGLHNCTQDNAHTQWNENDPENIVNAFHWYDGFSLFTKSFRSHFNVDTDTAKILIGKKKISEFYNNCLLRAIELTKKKMGNTPCFLGEFGLAFDINKGRAFKTNNYSLHEKALSMYYDAVDANLLHSTIWNYSASNTNKYGDNWNGEDLSIFSEGKERASAGWKRPYPMATAGKLHSFKWETKKRKFTCCYTADEKILQPTLIYLPNETFGKTPNVSFEGKLKLKAEFNFEEQLLRIYNEGRSGDVKVKITC